MGDGDGDVTRPDETREDDVRRTGGSRGRRGSRPPRETSPSRLSRLVSSLAVSSLRLRGETSSCCFFPFVGGENDGKRKLAVVE